MINYFCCNLYCIILLLYCAQYLILKTVILTFVYNIILCSFVFFVCYVFFLTSSMFGCCMTELVDLQNDMCVCMYVYGGKKEICTGFWWLNLDESYVGNET